MKNWIITPIPILLTRRLWVIGLFWIIPSIAIAENYPNEHFEAITISGTITDAQSNEPLIGVNILIKNTNRGTVTDLDGHYSITADNTSDILVFSYTGYNDQEITIGNRTTIDVKMETASELLDEVVVIGYGTQKKSSLTASVSVLDAEELQKLSTYDATTSLQGRASGVYVETDGGVAGANSHVVIRGTGSLTNSNPLYVIDGAFANSMSSLNPADIESIEVLKDASAASIYGSRAASGVVLVTTKKGKAGQTKFSLDISSGIQTPSKKIDYLNAREYADVMNRAARIMMEFPKPSKTVVALMQALMKITKIFG